MSSTPEWPVSVKGVVLTDGGVVLLRNERDEWELPGGRLEHGETPEDCVRREIREELAIEVAVGPVVDAWVYPVRPDRSVVVIGYGCRRIGDDPIRRSDEHLDVGVFALGQLDGLALPEGYRRTIRRWATMPPAER